MKKGSIIVIYSKDSKRKKEILSAMLKERNSVMNYFISIVNSPQNLLNVIQSHEKNIVGLIMDFENESKVDISDFIYQSMSFNEDIIPLFIPTKELKICYNKLNFVPFVKKNQIRCESFEELINKIPQFFEKCDTFIHENN